MIVSMRERFAALPASGPADELRLRAGTMGDYAALAEFHYLRNRPVTATRVLVLEDARPGIAERFGGGGPDHAGDRDRNRARARARGTCTGSEGGRVAAVLVESYPALGCALRTAALGERFRGWGDRRVEAQLVNAEVRCISRVVVHPQWRGSGIAVRLVKHALATMTTAYTEALAAMGRVNPFFRLAGMGEYRRWPLRRDQRLIDALGSCGIEPWELASAARMGRRVESEALLRDELRRWAGRGLSLEEQLAMARERLLCEPVYYVKGRGE
jgi:GNAT superfamily N-acetyltransferase